MLTVPPMDEKSPGPAAGLRLPPLLGVQSCIPRSQAPDGGLLSWVQPSRRVDHREGSRGHSTPPRVSLLWSVEKEKRRQRLRCPGLAGLPGNVTRGGLLLALPRPAAWRGAKPGSSVSLSFPLPDGVRGGGAGHRASCEPHSSKSPRDGKEGRD